MRALCKARVRLCLVKAVSKMRDTSTYTTYSQNGFRDVSSVSRLVVRGATTPHPGAWVSRPVSTISALKAIRGAAGDFCLCFCARALQTVNQ